MSDSKLVTSYATPNYTGELFLLDGGDSSDTNASAIHGFLEMAGSLKAAFGGYSLDACEDWGWDIAGLDARRCDVCTELAAQPNRLSAPNKKRASRLPYVLVALYFAVILAVVLLADFL